MILEEKIINLQKQILNQLKVKDFCETKLRTRSLLFLGENCRIKILKRIFLNLILNLEKEVYYF